MKFYIGFIAALLLTAAAYYFFIQVDPQLALGILFYSLASTLLKQSEGFL